MRIHRWGASGMRTRLAKTSPRAGLRAVSTQLAGRLLSAILSVLYAPMAPLSLDRSSGKPVSSATIGRCDFVCCVWHAMLLRVRQRNASVCCGLRSSSLRPRTLVASGRCASVCCRHRAAAFTCVTSTKVQLLTPSELGVRQGHTRGQARFFPR
jgi:hypothetical protein